MAELVKDLIQYLLQEVLQGLLTRVVRAIYGTEKAPRSVVWRGALRTLVFGGALATLFGLSGVVPFSLLPEWLVLFWFIAWLCLLIGEHDFGKKPVAWWAAASGLTVLAAGLAVLAT